jgi:hypothetical protein
MSEKRIYVIVPETVQHPLSLGGHVGHTVIVPRHDTITIVQPKGRIAAQVGHVTSRMRMRRMVEEVAKSERTRRRKLWVPCLEKLYGMAEEPITTIVLAVPDSYQLEFRQGLLEKAKIPVWVFFDMNEEYGPGSVKTAICTEPVEREKLYGIIDYLELWK